MVGGRWAQGQLDDADHERFKRSTAFASETSASSSAPSAVEKWKDKMKGNYNDRIRRWSSPEKLFEVFASVKKESGQLFMTLSDFRDSLLPSDFEDERNSRDLSVREVPEIFKLIDLDGDGLISFHEYVLFTAFLSIPLHHYELAFKMFDCDGNGTLSKEEFIRCMEALEKLSPYAATKRDAPFGLDPRAGVKSEQDGQEENFSGLLEVFFGKAGDRELPLSEFKDFMERFLMAVLHLEFDRFDQEGRESISARDFAMAIVGYAQPKDASRLRERVSELKSDARRISWQDFVNYQLAMQQIKEIVSALELYTSGMPFSRNEFEHAIFAVTGRSLSPVQLDIIFFLFDDDESGSFDLEEVVSIFQNRASRNLGNTRDLGFISRLKCCRTCFA